MGALPALEASEQPAQEMGGPDVALGLTARVKVPGVIGICIVKGLNPNPWGSGNMFYGSVFSIREF